VGKIFLEDIEFYAYHGHYAEERQTGGRFLVNLEIDAELEKACATDHLEDTYDYQQAYKIVSEEMQISSSLLEHVAGRILDRIIHSSERIKSATITLSKMNPPFGGNIKSVSIELTKAREE
jgi:7,8-dihydroneopterin aldolase/epimerase/oxygenase